MFERNLSALAATALTAGTVALSSAPAQASTIDEQTISVSIADLDLSTPKGTARLERRVRYAARQICGWDSGLTLGLKRKVAECHEQVIASAQDDVDLAIQRSGQRPGRLALRAR